MTDAVPFHGLAPRFLDGVLEIPVYHMRGGTSTGILLYEPHLPEDLPLREELIRHIMGVPLEGEVDRNAQITGLGRGIPQSCKVFIVDRAGRDDADIRSNLAQLAPTKAAIDWSVNCGNMSAALPVFASQVGLVSLAPGTNRVRIFNTNTGVVTHALLDMPEPGQPVASETEIPGVMGNWPGVQLALLEPVGAKTGRLLPTGNVTDTVDGIEVSCVDLAVPMVIVRAADLGKTASEAPEELDADPDLKDRLRRIWVAAGLKMGLTGKGGAPMTEAELAASETIPKDLHRRTAERSGTRARGQYPRPLFHAAGRSQVAGGDRRRVPGSLLSDPGHRRQRHRDRSRPAGSRDGGSCRAHGQSGRVPEGDYRGIRL